MSTHTPGPWRATGPNVRADTDDGDGALIAVVRDKHFFDGEPISLSELTANARLIAAAPDLLAIVAELARHDGMSGDLPMLIVKARAALAKATTTTQE